MQKNIFLIPHHQNYILYAPLKGIISLINKAAAKDLSKMDFSTPEDSFQNESDLKNNYETPINQVTFILTSDCSMRCIYCYAEGGKSNKTLTWEMFSGVVDYVICQNKKTPSPQPVNIAFHGGDISIVWKLFKKAVEYIQDRFTKACLPFNISLGINGVLSNVQLQFLVANTSNATVSLDGFNEIQNHSRPLSNGKDSFNKVDNTLKYFDSKNYRYGIRSTVTALTVNRLAEIIDFFCLNYAVKRIMVEPMFPLGRGINVQAPSDKDFVYNFRKARQLTKSYNRELVYSGARLNDITSIFCKALDNSVVITPEGLISCCYEIIDNETTIADYFIHGFFDNIKKELVFDKQKQMKLKEYIKNENEKCEDCFCKFHCAGDCPVKAISVKHSQTKVTADRCYINRELTKDLILEALGE
jgi:uncharacterized protein